MRLHHQGHRLQADEHRRQDFYQSRKRVTSYTYDKLGQLLTTTTGNTVITYSYDLSGNITSKQTKVSGVVTQTAPYGYSNAQWGEQLTSYNGQTISYDDDENNVAGMLDDWGDLVVGYT